MSLKTWMLGKMSRPLQRTDLPPRRAAGRAAAGGSALREPSLRWEAEGRAPVPTTLEHLGPYGALIAAVRSELEHFASSDLRLHLAIAERDRYLLTSIDIDDTGSEQARETLERFSREFAPEQVKHYVAREIIARLPNAGAIDLSQFAGLNAGRKAARATEEGEAYAELLKELRSAEPTAGKHDYQVTLVGRWSETDPRSRNVAASRAGAALTPLPGRGLAFDITDAEGSRRVELAAVVPGRRYVVGKDPHCDVVVNGVYASRRHCELWLEKDSCWVADCGSTNGIRVESPTVGAAERPSRANAAADRTALEVEPGACIVLSASARGDATQYPRLVLRPLAESGDAARNAVARARATPVTPIASPRGSVRELTLTVQMASGSRTVDLPREPGPFRVGRSRTQGLVIDWAHEGVSGHHLDILEPDEAGARVVVHGDNGVSVAGTAYAPGSEFRWKLGETLVFGRSGREEPECSLTLSRRS